MIERQNIGWRVKKDGAYFVRVGPGMVEWNPARKCGLLFIVSSLAHRVASMTGGRVVPVFKVTRDQ